MRQHPLLGASLLVYPKRPNASTWEHWGYITPTLRKRPSSRTWQYVLEKYLLILFSRTFSRTDFLGSMNRFGEQTSGCPRNHLFHLPSHGRRRWSCPFCSSPKGTRKAVLGRVSPCRGGQLSMSAVVNFSVSTHTSSRRWPSRALYCPECWKGNPGTS